MKERLKKLEEFVESKLSQAKELRDEEANVVVLHQDAFGADYQDEEYYLLGAYIKYLGEKGKEIHIIGKNRETIKDK